MNLLRKTAVPVALAILAANVVACRQKSEPEPPKPRWQYTQEDFGMGRPHTKSTACNGEIDRLLNEVRLCYNAREAAQCDAWQTKNSKHIAQLKNTQRCRS